MSEQFEPNTELNVSKKWEQKFKLLDKLGADKAHIFSIRRDQFNQLSWQEKLSIRFNILAFFFTVLYYGAKGMWLKAAFIFSATIVFSVLLGLLGIALDISIHNIFYSLPLSIFCALTANYDYYKHVKEGKKGWQHRSGIFSSNVVAIATFVLAMLLLTVRISYLDPSSVPRGADSEYNYRYVKSFRKDVSAVWSVDYKDTLVTIDLLSKTKTVSIGESAKETVEIVNVHPLYQSVFIRVLKKDGSDQYWTIQKIYSDDVDGFTLNLELQDSRLDLSFVRDL